MTDDGEEPETQNEGEEMRLATFNCENLFARYKFQRNFDPTHSDGFTINNLAFDIYD